MRWKLIALAITGVMAGHAAAAQVLGTWSFDEDKEGWIARGGPAITSAGWTETEGNPPGSLFSAGESLTPARDCFEASGSRTYVVSAEVASGYGTDVVCIVWLEGHTDAACSGTFGTLIDYKIARPGQEWELLAATVPVPEEFRSFRPAIFGGADARFDSCFFDNVSLVQAPAVPTMSSVTLAVLVGVLAAVAVVRLRRQADERR